MKKGLDAQIDGLNAKIVRLNDEGKEIPMKMRYALTSLMLARQKWRRRKAIVRELSA